ncbi:DUF4157 domain-containing protein [Amycolatopsis sp. NPDC051061]|uniref:eCIS core domain-containing protein n=1 Tax=Amycolatopsis sp. NPDC051061 TaxID=3155042 RepID=UPI0034277872
MTERAAVNAVPVVAETRRPPATAGHDQTDESYLVPGHRLGPDFARLPVRGRARLLRHDHGQEAAADAAGDMALAGGPVTSPGIPDGPATTALPDSFGTRLHDLLGKGMALPPAAAESVGANGFADVSRVCIHTGAGAQQLTGALGAEAFTAGNDIFFGPGRFGTTTAAGRHLLAHELTHTVQARRDTALVVRAQRQTPLAARVTRLEVRATARDGVRGEPLGRNVAGSVRLYTADGKLLTELPLTFLGLPAGHYTEPVGGIANSEGYVIAWSSKSAEFGARVQAAVIDVVIAEPATAGGSPRHPSGPGNGGHGPKKPETPGTGQGPSAGDPAKNATNAPEDLPPEIREILGRGVAAKNADPEQLARIVGKLKRLTPAELQMYRELATRLTGDITEFERSLDRFLVVKGEIQREMERRRQEKKAAAPTLSDQLDQTWHGVDLGDLSAKSQDEREAIAREVADRQTAVHLRHMATHPGELATGMVEGVVRPDKVAAGIVDDVKEAADGSRNPYARSAAIAGAVGKYEGYVAGVAGVLFVALLFVPGVNVAELALVGMLAGELALAASATEAELRIQSAARETDPTRYQSDVAKSSAATVNVIVQAALLALHLAAKLVARIPLGQRYQTVGHALGTARTQLLKVTGAGAALENVRASLLSRLRAAKPGLLEGLQAQNAPLQAASKRMQGMTGRQVVEAVAAGDSALAECTGLTPEAAKKVLAMDAATGTGSPASDQVKAGTLEALRDAPAEAKGQVDRFHQHVDETVKAVEQARTPEELKAAVDAGETDLGAKTAGQEQQAAAQSVVAKRLTEAAAAKEAARPADTTPSAPAEKSAPAPAEKAPAATPGKSKVPPVKPEAQQKLASARSRVSELQDSLREANDKLRALEPERRRARIRAEAAEKNRARDPAKADAEAAELERVEDKANDLDAERRTVQEKLGAAEQAHARAQLEADPLGSRLALPCFSGDTEVWTPAGTRRIDSLRAGTPILSFDLYSREVVVHRVLQVLRNRTTRFHEITAAGVAVRATGRHRFWVEEARRWVTAAELRPGMKLRRVDGALVAIDSVRRLPETEAVTWNLTVESTPHYFVGPGVLVHNEGPFNVGLGGDQFLYIGTNPDRPGEVYVGRTDDILRRRGQHRSDAAQALRTGLDKQGRPLTKKLRDFFEFMAKVNLEPQLSGLTKDTAIWSEQHNIDLEQAKGNQIVNRREEMVTRTEEIRRRIVDDPKVQAEGYCP